MPKLRSHRLGYRDLDESLVVHRKLEAGTLPSDWGKANSSPSCDSQQRCNGQVIMMSAATGFGGLDREGRD